MLINTFIPLPGPVVPIGIVPPYMGGSPVPPRLVRDLGYEATHPTVKGHEGWRVDLTR